MKRLISMFIVASMVVSCNDSGTATETKATDTSKGTASATNYDYPYKLDRPYSNWQPGDQQNAVNAMKSLKGYETGDIATAVQYFGDSVDLRFDNFRAKLSHDSLQKMFTRDRAEIASMTIKMDDWESVISTDKKDQWVNMWYTQIWTDKKGKTDSMAFVDDMKFVNGKIVVLDEKLQHFPAKK